MPSTLVDRIRSFVLSEVLQVTFIENKTNYEEYLLSERTEHELVIYHGGFLSPQKRKLFQKLAQSCAHDLPVRFWADIDLGGFQMFTELHTLFPKLLPMRMSAAEVEQYHAYGLVRPVSYLKQVELQLASHQYPIFEDAMEQILKYGVTIEQEVFL
ncbi:MAG: Wadjet anti-phage system protein JetD domain-containing protein [Candidatus Avoscillospira sp.]